jgi:membrane fusion protein (multidrug efflux system)
MKSKSLAAPLRGIRFLSLAALAIVLAAVCGCRKEEPPAPPPAEVVAVAVMPRTVPVTVPFVAQAESSHQVEIVARVNGFLEKILYKEGEVVKAGQVLFLMDRKPFRAQVSAAQGEVANREAQLWTAKANLDRIKPLAEQDAASKSDLDNATGAVKSAEAAVYEARARLEKAELDLGYATIKSPVSGVSGQALMREGAYLSGVGEASQLTYVATLDPIWINFSVSQNQMSGMRQDVAEGRLVVPEDQAYEVEIDLSDGSHYPHRGRLSFADPSFRPDTGTFLVRAELPNPQGVLRPGMFVKAYIKGAVRPKALVVPQKAVQQTANGHVVYVVGEDEKAELRPVVVGEWVGTDWVIDQGLQAGDRVIIEGFQRLAPGAPVKITAPQAAPPAETAKPVEPGQPEEAAKAGETTTPAAPAPK